VALAIDGSTPAKVTGTTTAISTAAFSPPANAQLVAFVVRNVGFHNFNADGTVTSTGGLSWSLAGRKSVNAGSTNGAGTDGCTEIWVANTTTAPGSMTVTDTRGDGLSGSGAEHILKVEVFTGAESPWAGAITGTSSTSGLPSASVTTTQANSWVFASSSDWSAGGVGTVGSGQTMIDEDDVAGQYDAHIWRQTSTTGSSGTNVTMNLTAPAAEQYNELAIEIRETAVTATDAGGRIQSGFHPGRGPTSARFYQTPKSRDVVVSGTTFTQNLAGSVTASGVLTLATSKALAGTSTPTGALAKAVTKPGLAGSSTPRGALAKQANKALAGSVTATGVLSAVKVVLRSFAGSVTPTGVLSKQVNKAVAGSVTATGTLTRQVAKALAGSVTPSGALAKAVAKALAGSVTPAGVLTTMRVVLRSFAGSVIPTGVLTRQTGKALSGSVTPTGSLAKQVSKALSGVVAAAGALAKLVAKPFSGRSTPTGAATVVNQGATQNATSASTLTAAAYTSTGTASAGRTSTSSTTAGRTSTPDVSDG
jgi:hypothetical protein